MTPAPNRVDELKKRYEENPRRFFAPLANEYRKAGDLEAAIDLCRMHLEEQPGHLSGHIVYGQALFESTRLPDAKRIFEAALTLDPENLIALRHLGDIAKADGDAATAKHWYGRVLEADPRNDEVTALIDSLGQLEAAPTVIVAEPQSPPPPPNYAEAQDAAVAESAAPTPVIPMAAVPATPAAPRLSVGLMDLDLNLADSTAPTIDLLGAMDAPTPVATEGAAPLTVDAVLPIEPTPPAVLEAAPTIDEGFALAETGEAAPSIEGSALPGVEDLALSATLPGAAELDVQDTSFDAPPVDEAPMFGAEAAVPSFGDSLDVTASGDVDESLPPRVSLLDSIPVIDTGDAVPIGESVTEPKPITHIVEAAAPEASPTLEAPPAPATPADFDALFGNAPIADVTIGGASDTVAAAETGFVADSFVGREPTDELLETAPDIATPPSPFVTETMAELYLQQGFRDEALEVYRQLLAQNPDDHGLAERVKHLEHGTRSSLAIDSVSEQIEAHVKAEEIRLSGSIPTVPAEPVVADDEARDRAPIIEAPSGPAPIIEMIPEPATPTPVMVRAVAPTPVVPMPPVVEAEPVMEMVSEAPLAPVAAVEPEPVPAAVPAPVGPTAREIFARIAQRRAVPGGGATPAIEAAPVGADARRDAADAPSTPAPVEAVASIAAAMPPAQEVPVAPGGSLDRLFGMSGISAVDEGAALAMAAAYGGVPVAPLKGEPARRVTDELSLDSVFKGEDGGRPTAVQRQSTRLRFDQFFAGNEGGEAPPSPPPSPAAPADDIAQFTDWLKGLKGT